MVQQNFAADDTEDDSAGQFRAGFPFCAEQIPYFYTDSGKNKSDNSNQTDGRQNRDLQKRKGDAQRQRVDTRGKRQDQHVPARQGGVRLRRLVLYGLGDHPDSKEYQQAK